MSQTNTMMTILSNTFIIVGTLLLFITSGSTSIGGILAGYSFIGIGLLLTLSYTIKLINDSSSESKSWFGVISPFILILSVIGYSIYLVVTYQNKIKSGHISQGYYNFSNISIVLILVQLMLFYSSSSSQTANDSSKEGKGGMKIDRVFSMLLFFIGILNIVTVITIGIILALFNTDD